MPIGELDVVEFELCGGLRGKEIVGLEAFYEKMCGQRRARHVCWVERHMQKSSQ